jgi:acetyltransferase-like isoleucine patch superfamily enzyme
MRTIILVANVALALFPSWLKIPIYRTFFGYKIGKGVHIGFSPFIGICACRIDDHVRIGSFNVFYRVRELQIGAHAKIGFFNLFRGGDRITVGPYCAILRQNVFNAIIDRDFVGPVDSTLILGTGCVVTTGHWLDFSARIDLGDQTIIGGRNSSLWTHNRQRGRNVTIGCHCYLGSEIRIAPGTEISPFCVVALGSVLSGRHGPPRSLIGGNPATVIRTLGHRDLTLIAYKTRNDIPNEIAEASLPDDLRAAAVRSDEVETAIPA